MFSFLSSFSFSFLLIFSPTVERAGREAARRSPGSSPVDCRKRKGKSKHLGQRELYYHTIDKAQKRPTFFRPAAAAFSLSLSLLPCIYKTPPETTAKMIDVPLCLCSSCIDTRCFCSKKEKTHSVTAPIRRRQLSREKRKCHRRVTSIAIAFLNLDATDYFAAFILVEARGNSLVCLTFTCFTTDTPADCL